MASCKDHNENLLKSKKLTLLTWQTNTKRKKTTTKTYYEFEELSRNTKKVLDEEMFCAHDLENFFPKRRAGPRAVP